MGQRIELTISLDYLPNWGVLEGCREIIQNARDAEIQHGAKMDIDFRVRRIDGYETGGLIITNTGCTIPLDALLLGHTTKLGDSRLIGKYGEGFKLGILALLRSGYKVKIRNGSEVWEPKIEKSINFDSQVLVFEVHKGRKFEDRVQFEIIGIDDRQWEDIKSKTLFISDEPIEKLSCYNGSLLLDKKYAGKIFLKGIYVSNYDIEYGFDFADGDIDRDRRMPSDIRMKVENCCTTLMDQEFSRKIIGDWYFNKLYSGEFAYGYVYGEVATYVAEKFAERHPDTIATENAEEENALAHLGGKGKVVNRHLRNILDRTIGSAAEKIKSLKLNHEKTYELSELTSEEINNFEFCANLVQRAYYATGEVSDLNIDIVDFKDEKLLGTYTSGGNASLGELGAHTSGKIKIARKLLTNRPKLIVTLVHEAAHKYGNNGEEFHRAGELIMASVIEDILEKLP